MGKAAGPSKSSSAMAMAWKLYDAGNVAQARAEAARVLAQPPSPQEAEQARDLLQRTGIPKLGVALAAIAAVLLGLMLVLAVVRG